MNDELYTVTVHNVVSQTQQGLAAPQITDGVIVRYNEASFRGLRATRLEDTDGDGLLDPDEQTGYAIAVTAADGTVSQVWVASDYTSADSDGDGVDDGTEFLEGLNPRSPDTDADTISDFDELSRYMSDARSADGDGDGLNDPTERFFRTSLLLADTDGDQYSDYEEVLERLRNPRVADLPQPIIDVGSINLAVDWRYAYTDSSGTARSEARSFETSLTSSREDAFTRADSTTIGAFAQIGASFESCVGPECSEVPTNFATFSLGAELRGGASFDYNFSSDESTVRASTDAFNDAVSTGTELSNGEEVTRTVESAVVSVAVSFRIGTDVSFTLTNLELSLLMYDPDDPGGLLPVATLLPATEGLTVTLGPLYNQAGPFVFQNAEIFPQQVEALMRNPSNAFVKVANYDVLDEDGRNLSFTAQRVRELAGQLVIDYGNGSVEKFEISAASDFDLDTGLPLGLPLTEALEVIGLQARGGCVATCPHPGGSPARSDACPANLPFCLEGKCLRDCETSAECGPGRRCIEPGGQNVDQLSANLCLAICETSAECAMGACVERAEAGGGTIRACDRDWSFTAPGGADSCHAVTDGTGFYGVRRVGDELKLEFVRDVRAELPSAQPDVSSDAGTPLLHPKQRRAWIVFDGTDGFDPGTQAFRPSSDISNIYISPGRTVLLAFTQDRDGDTLWEIEELAFGSSDLKIDTDGDGLPDYREVRGLLAESRTALFDDTAPVDCPTPLESNVLPMRADCRWRVTTDLAFGGYRTTSSPVFSDSDGDRVSDADEASYRHSTYGVTPTDPYKTDTDEDGLSDLAERSAQSHTLRYGDRREVTFTTSAVHWDTDGDGLNDGLEVLIGLHPTEADAEQYYDLDRDGLPEAVEDDGWTICLGGQRAALPHGGWACTEGGRTVVVTSTDTDSDTDDDGLSDYVEFKLGTDPSESDSDGDGLDDRDEWDHLALLHTFAGACERLPGCTLPDPEQSLLFGTLPWSADTDDDGVSDGVEINGWTVSLLGGGRDGPVPARQVYSNPRLTDTDGDALSDWVEWTYPGGSLDPSNRDTDADGLSDAHERFKQDSQGRARHPLRPDARVAISFLAIDARATVEDTAWRLVTSVETRGATHPQLTDAGWRELAAYLGRSVAAGCPADWEQGPGSRYQFMENLDPDDLIVARVDHSPWEVFLTLGYDEVATIAGEFRSTVLDDYPLGADDTLSCLGAPNVRWFGGEGATPEEKQVTGALDRPKVITFTQTDFRPRCGGQNCRFDGTVVFRAFPVLGNAAVAEDLRLTHPDSGLPVVSPGVPAVLEFFDGDDWGVACAPEFVKATADRACRELFGSGYTATDGGTPTRNDLYFTASNFVCGSQDWALTDCDYNYGYDVDSSCDTPGEAMTLVCNR
jgi:hypothetical protein